MNKILIIVIAAVFIIPITIFADETPQMTFEAAKTQAAKLNKPILAEFYAVW